MAPTTPRLRILSVGGNSVSAFLSWRLSATNACDVTLVWKSGFESVAQYGISFRSSKFGNERFKPRHVVRTPEEAAGASRASFDYVVLCVKALPDVYDLASVIESVVSPQHTCILVNTSHTLGIESYLEQRFPTNVVLSLVSGAEITQLGPAEFEHKGSTELWVGAANRNPAIPASIQNDMAEALSMTLKSGQVDCEVSSNIRQQQYERTIGNIAFHPASVLFETPQHAELLEKVGARSLVSGVIDELLAIARAQGCQFKSGYREQVMEQMILPTESSSTMYQDFLARRPMEVETYLGSPIKLSQEVGVPVPRIETLYALLHSVNTINQSRSPPSPVAPVVPQHTPRISSAPSGPPMGPAALRGSVGGPMSRPPMSNGMGPPRSRAHSSTGGPMGAMRRPPGMNGPMHSYPGPRGVNGNGYGPRGPPPQRRHTDMEENGLEEFSHLMLYDDMVDEGGYDMPNGGGGDIALRERELAIRQKELALREREYRMRQGRMGPSGGGYDDDDEDGEDFFDPMGGPGMGPDADNIDMMSVTSRRTRKAPSAGQLRANPEFGGMRNGRGGFKRGPPKNRTSATLMNELPNLRDELMNNPLMGYSSDRYANVDRHNMGVESRTNSLTAERLNELQQGGGPMPNGYGGGPFPGSRRGSQSPANLLNGANGQITPRPNLRPSPPNGASYGNGRPSPPGMRQPVPRYPPGQGNAAPPPQQLEQQNGMVGVSNPHPSSLYPLPKGVQHQQHSQVRSLTGSASASAASGESSSQRASSSTTNNAPIDSSHPSAHSSASSFGPGGARPPIGVR